MHLRKNRSGQPNTSIPPSMFLIDVLLHSLQSIRFRGKAYTPNSTYILSKLLAPSGPHCNLLIEQLHLCLERTVANAKDTGQTVRCFNDIPFLAGNIIVWVRLRNHVFVLSLTKTAKQTLQAILILFHQVMSSF
jgi:hypothetical protein